MNKMPLILLFILAALFLTSCTSGSPWGATATIAPTPTPAVSLEEYLADGTAF